MAFDIKNLNLDVLKNLTNPILDTVSEGYDVYETIFKPAPVAQIQATQVVEKKAPEVQAPVLVTANIAGPPVQQQVLPGFLNDVKTNNNLVYIGGGFAALLITILALRR